jgi:hypothetical protein
MEPSRKYVCDVWLASAFYQQLVWNPAMSLPLKVSKALILPFDNKKVIKIKSMSNLFVGAATN